VSNNGTPPTSRGAALAVALGALEALALVAETVADEWTYVSRLTASGRARLARAAGPAPETPLAEERASAVVAAAAEAGRVNDPHRAIDWLSTFPAVVELAMTAPAGIAAPSEGATDESAASRDAAGTFPGA
jgi:hypothetical protein